MGRCWLSRKTRTPTPRSRSCGRVWSRYCARLSSQPVALRWCALWRLNKCRRGVPLVLSSTARRASEAPRAGPYKRSESLGLRVGVPFDCATRQGIDFFRSRPRTVTRTPMYEARFRPRRTASTGSTGPRSTCAPRELNILDLPVASFERFTV